MIPDQFFHPDHVIPTVILIAAFFESSHQPVAEMGMEIHAVVVKVFVILFGNADTGFHIEDSHLF